MRGRSPGSTSRHGAERGSAMLIVLWAIALLSVVVMGVVELVGYGVDEDTIVMGDFRARQLAESGLALALHPQVEVDDPILEQELPHGESFRVDIGSEGARLHINYLLSKGKGSEEVQVLERLFTIWGMTMQEIDRVIDCLIDWTDGNDMTQRNGAEWEEYARAGRLARPSNKEFEDVDEMASVMGMELVMRVEPGWRDSFTVLSDGRIDVNEASPEILRAATGAGEREAEQVEELRLGPDLLRQTEDDVRFQSLEEFASSVRISTAQLEQSRRFLTVESPVQRIESVGRVGDLERMIVVVRRKESRGSTYLAWEER